MRTFLITLIGLVVGYVLGALLWNYAVMAVSSNTHDKILEAQMTAAFIGGPIGAIIGVICGWLVARHR
ncbi:MAG: hypothetical protein CTY31_11895 [Hyphomicrobium sp.]|nr:MAG: hypothetical protein CTY31_11895 [Hyphomicrobium sp.]